MRFKATGGNTGSVTGTPATGDVGEHQITLLATDPGGAGTEQKFKLNVFGKVFNAYLPALGR